MYEQRVKEIIEADVFQEDNRLFSLGWYLAWPKSGEDKKYACLDGDFTADELEAIAWWMKNK